MAQWRLAGPQEAGAQPEVPVEVLGGRHRQPGRHRAEELRFRRLWQGHASVEPVEGLEAAGQPRDTLLGEDDPKRWEPLEHAREDEVPHRSVGEPGQLDEHHGSGRLVVPVIGQATTTVDLDGDVELLTDAPERVVVRLPEAGQARVGGNRR